MKYHHLRGLSWRRKNSPSRLSTIQRVCRKRGSRRVEAFSPSLSLPIPPLLHQWCLPEDHVHVLGPREAQQGVLEPRALVVHPGGPAPAGPVPLVEGVIVVHVVAAEERRGEKARGETTENRQGKKARVTGRRTGRTTERGEDREGLRQRCVV